MRKYQLTEQLSALVKQDVFERWLQRKASAHVRRDRNRGNKTATIESYKIAIHKAVCECEGYDVYTNEKLDWSLLSKYDNAESKKNGRHYKKQFALLPSVDHIGDGLGKAAFRICAWRTNDSKSDLSYHVFVELCSKVVETAANKNL